MVGRANCAHVHRMLASTNHPYRASLWCQHVRVLVLRLKSDQMRTCPRCHSKECLLTFRQMLCVTGTDVFALYLATCYASLPATTAIFLVVALRTRSVAVKIVEYTECEGAAAIYEVPCGNQREKKPWPLISSQRSNKAGQHGSGSAFRLATIPAYW